MPLIFWETVKNEPLGGKMNKAWLVCQTNIRDFASITKVITTNVTVLLRKTTKTTCTFIEKSFFFLCWKKTLTRVFLFADDLQDKCEKLLCKCDRDAAKCLRKAPYIPKYAVWPDFLCGVKQPMCNIYWHNKCICMSCVPFVNRGMYIGLCHSNHNGIAVKTLFFFFFYCFQFIPL